MSDPVATSLVERVERLERTNRRWRTLCLATFGGVGLLIATGAVRYAPDKLEARELIVNDKDGKPRLHIRTDESGNPSIVFTTKAGLPRINMGLGGGPDATTNPYFNFSDGAGWPRLLMGAGGGPGPEEDAYLNIRSKDQKILFSAPGK